MNLRQAFAQTVSYAGIIRIRFQGFKARLPCLSRKHPAPPFDCVCIVALYIGIVKKGLFIQGGSVV